jgi:hypothetical protein
MCDTIASPSQQSSSLSHGILCSHKLGNDRVPHVVDQLVAWKTDVCWCNVPEGKATSQRPLQA